MPKIHPPYPCYGGKFNHLNYILPEFPSHRAYVEVFGGGASVLLNKLPSPVEVYNDIDSGAVNFFRVLRDFPDELVRRAALTPYSREEYYSCKRAEPTQRDPIERARMWFFVAATSFNGRYGQGLSTSARCAHGGAAAPVASYINRVEMLWKVAARLRTVIIENLDFRELIPRYDTPDTLFYLDPPYVHDTRDATATYEHEMSDNDHTDLVQILLGIQGKAVLSGYDNQVYEALETAGWRKVQYEIRSTSAYRGNLRGHKRLESLWISPQTC